MPKLAPRSLAAKFKQAGYKPKRLRTEPLWTGPNGEGPLGGITFSSLCKFINCRERFRIAMIEGIRGVERFSSRMDYGNFWHTCEEHFAAGKDWKKALNSEVAKLGNKYPNQRKDILKWGLVCATEFPHYIDHWKKHPDVKQRKGICQEQVFDIPYVLPSGRQVRLRGKFDGIDIIGKGKQAGIYLFETKSKSDIDELALYRQLRFDLQTMLYLTAMQNLFYTKHESTVPIAGVRYNVIRRPLSGGKHSIVQRQAKNPKKGKRVAAESDREYMERLSGLIRENPNDFFVRFRVEVTPQEILAFRRTCLDPILEQLCQWWDCMSDYPNDPFNPHPYGDQCPGDPPNCLPGIHWRHPFGVFNAIDEGYGSDLDDYIETGDMTGLHQVDTLFTELQ